MISTTAPTWRVRNLATLSVLALLLASTSALTLGARKEDAAPAAPADAECEGGQCEVPNDWPAAEAAAGADDDDVEVVDLDDDVDDPLLEPSADAKVAPEAEGAEAASAEAAAAGRRRLPRRPRRRRRRRRRTKRSRRPRRRRRRLRRRRRRARASAGGEAAADDASWTTSKVSLSKLSKSKLGKSKVAGGEGVAAAEAPAAAEPAAASADAPAASAGGDASGAFGALSEAASAAAAAPAAAGEGPYTEDELQADLSLIRMTAALGATSTMMEVLTNLTYRLADGDNDGKLSAADGAAFAKEHLKPTAPLAKTLGLSGGQLPALPVEDAAAVKGVCDRILAKCDADKDGLLSRAEAKECAQFLFELVANVPMPNAPSGGQPGTSSYSPGGAAAAGGAAAGAAAGGAAKAQGGYEFPASMGGAAAGGAAAGGAAAAKGGAAAGGGAAAAGGGAAAASGGAAKQPTGPTQSWSDLFSELGKQNAPAAKATADQWAAFAPILKPLQQHLRRARRIVQQHIDRPNFNTYLASLGLSSLALREVLEFDILDTRRKLRGLTGANLPDFLSRLLHVSLVCMGAAAFGQF